MAATFSSSHMPVTCFLGFMFVYLLVNSQWTVFVCVFVHLSFVSKVICL